MTPIVWSPQAILDLEAIEAYVSQDSPMAARRLVQRIVQRTERLQRSPQSGGWLEEDERKRYRQVLYGNYRVVYRHDAVSKIVNVLTVIHAARLLDPGQLNRRAHDSDE